MVTPTPPQKLFYGGIMLLGFVQNVENFSGIEPETRSTRSNVNARQDMKFYALRIGMGGFILALRREFEEFASHQV